MKQGVLEQNMFVFANNYMLSAMQIWLKAELQLRPDSAPLRDSKIFKLKEKLNASNSPENYILTYPKINRVFGLNSSNFFNLFTGLKSAGLLAQNVH